MKTPSVTILLCGIFTAYVFYSVWSLYSLFKPAPCLQNSKQCLKSYLSRNPPPSIELWIYSAKEESPTRNGLTLLWNINDFNVNEEVSKELNVSIPIKTRNNGSLFVHVFVTPSGEDPFSSSWRIHEFVSITTYAIPQANTFQLVSDDTSEKKVESRYEVAISHFRSRLSLNLMNDDVTFESTNVPAEIIKYIKLLGKEYLPILYIDEISFRTTDLISLNKTCKEMPLTIVYSPISVGKLRLWTNMKESLDSLQTLGFNEKDADEVKGLFIGTNLYLLLLTFFVAAFHLLFDFLAFKNDISYWRKRETMVGLSTKTVVWRCVSTMIIFLYLMDEQTSLLVLIPAGIGSIIEVWKVLKAFKVKMKWFRWFPTFDIGSASDKERETQALDTQAMKYLLYVLYPLCLAGAVYSLLYTAHKSWYSWCIKSLVNGVYAFGFIFMLPQLFINYKLKSVAHLPWKAFMYKAFNTFIDDVFAFIITMPTAHRLACFRDDIIFVIYLYQRWLYPVDKTRVNEFGQSFEESEKDEKVRNNSIKKSDNNRTEMEMKKQK